jgi:hypothetical protein
VWFSHADLLKVITSRSSGRFADDHFIHVAPDPFLPRLNRPNDGVMHVMEVLSSVFILRRIATADVAADHTQAQMNPRIAKFYAFFADMRLCRCDFDLIEMFAVR